MRFSLKGEMKKISLLVLILNFCLPLILAVPFINFTNPTPNDELITINTSIEINVSIVESNLGSLIYNWNGTNFSFYDGDLRLHFGFNNNSNLGDTIENLINMIDVSKYSTNGTRKPYEAADSFEIDTGNWAYRDGTFTTPTKDCTTAASGSCSINMTNTAATFGSVYIDNPGNVIPKTGMIVEFDYRCESGILWGMMFYDGIGWGCIQGSGTANCGAAFSAGGSFSPAITCDDTWRHANYSINWAGATMNYPIIGDWGSSNTPNKRLWFDNFVIRKPLTYTSGKYGQGMEFDGIGDYISIPQTFFDSETFSLWVKTTDTGPLMTWSQGDLAGYYDRTITINSAATLNVSWYIWNKATIYSNRNVNDGNWHHIATTGNITEMNIYIDGVLSSSRVADSRSDATLDTHITIGGGATGYLNATIDEVSVWNRSLSADEIYQLYVSNLKKFNSTDWYLYVNQSKNATSGLDLGTYTYQTFATNSSGDLNQTELRTLTITTDATFPLVNFTSPTPANATSTTNTSFEINVSIVELNLNESIYNWNNTNYSCIVKSHFGVGNYSCTNYEDSSLVLAMNFDNVSAIGENDTHLVDIADGLYNGTVVSAPWHNSTGKYNGAFEFDGVDDYINTSYYGETRTLSFWFNTKDFDTMKGLFGQRYDSVEESGNWQMHWDNDASNNKLRIYTYDSGIVGNDFVTSTKFETNTWYHVVVTSEEDDMRYYVNGVLDGQSTLMDVVLGGGGNDDNLVIGGGFGNTVLYPFNGTLDEVRVWNRTLSADEAHQQYASSLQKFNATQWNLYVNQSDSNKEFVAGNYSYFACAIDNSSNQNCTETRTMIFEPTSPQINFTSSTPANASSQSETNVEINVSITEANLDEIEYNWNGTNYTVYNDSLLLMFNFDNLSSLGETDIYAVDVSGRDGAGSISGASLSSGKYGNAFDFEGTSDLLTLSRSVPMGTAWTLCTWTEFPLSASTGWRTLVRGRVEDHHVIVDSSGNLGIYDNGGSNSVDCSPTLDTDSYSGWHHLCAIGAGTKTVFYIDADNVCNSSDLGTGDVDYIGNYQSGGQDWGARIDEFKIWGRTLSSDEIYQQYISNLNKFNSTQWYLYVNQSKNATDGLDTGNYTYQTFAQDNAGNLNFTDIRTITISSSGCPATPQNWAVSMSDNLAINSECNLTGYNITFSGTGSFTINSTFYVNEINGFTDGMTIWMKQDGILYSGVT